MKDSTSVGLGECAISRNPDDVLVAYGLGSCLGIAMIDPVLRICGLMHAVLPLPSNGTNSADGNPYKFVEGGIQAMIDNLAKEGANRNRLVVRIAGGANMLMSSGLSQSFDIGTRNTTTARAVFQRLRLTVSAEEVGGHTGRTVRVYVADKRVTVRVVGEKEHDLQ